MKKPGAEKWYVLSKEPTHSRGREFKTIPSSEPLNVGTQSHTKLITVVAGPFDTKEAAAEVIPLFEVMET